MCVQDFSAFQIREKNLAIWNSIDFEDFERMSEDKEASQYFEKIRSLYTYRDEKLMRSVFKKKVERGEDEDDEELFARSGFDHNVKTSFDHLHRIRRKLYESSQISDKRERYMSKILEKSTKLERNRSSSSKSSRRRVPVPAKRRAFLLPPQSTVSESRTSKDVQDSWLKVCWNLLVWVLMIFAKSWIRRR